MMIDRLLQSRICFGCSIPRSQVLFGEPTEDGKKFAVKFLKMEKEEQLDEQGTFRYL